MSKKIGLYLIYNDVESKAYKETWNAYDSMVYVDTNPLFFDEHLYRVNAKEEPKHSILTSGRVFTVPTVLILEMDEANLSQKVINRFEGDNISYEEITKTVKTNLSLLETGADLPEITTIKKSELTGKTVKFFGLIIPKWIKVLSIGFAGLITFLIAVFVLKKLYVAIKS